MHLRDFQLAIFIGLIVAGCGPDTVAPEREAADRVLANGFVYTVDAERSVAEAVALNAGSETARYLAGGTDLVVNIRRGIEAPETLIDLTSVTEMTEIREDADGLHIGAAVKLQDLGTHDIVQRDYAAVPLTDRLRPSR